MAKLKLMAQFGGRRSRGAVYGTEHWCLASAGSRRSECNVLGSEHHTECDGYLGTPVVAPRLYKIGDRKSEIGNRRLEIGDRRSEIGNRKSEIGGRKSEVGNQIAGARVRGESCGWGPRRSVLEGHNRGRWPQRARAGRKKAEWSGAGSNRRHMDFQSIALPTELPDQIPP